MEKLFLQFGLFRRAFHRALKYACSWNEDENFEFHVTAQLQKHLLSNRSYRSWPSYDTIPSAKKDTVERVIFILRNCLRGLSHGQKAENCLGRIAVLILKNYLSAGNECRIKQVDSIKKVLSF